MSRIGAPFENIVPSTALLSLFLCELPTSQERAPSALQKRQGILPEVNFAHITRPEPATGITKLTACGKTNIEIPLKIDDANSYKDVIQHQLDFVHTPVSANGEKSSGGQDIPRLKKQKLEVIPLRNDLTAAELAWHEKNLVSLLQSECNRNQDNDFNGLTQRVRIVSVEDESELAVLLHETRNNEPEVRVALVITESVNEIEVTRGYDSANAAHTDKFLLPREVPVDIYSPAASLSGYQLAVAVDEYSEAVYDNFHSPFGSDSSNSPQEQEAVQFSPKTKNSDFGVLAEAVAISLDVDGSIGFNNAGTLLSISEAPKECAVSEDLSQCNERKPSKAPNVAESGFENAGSYLPINETLKEYDVPQKPKCSSKTKTSDLSAFAEANGISLDVDGRIGFNNAGTSLSTNEAPKDCAVSEVLSQCNERIPSKTPDEAGSGLKKAGSYILETFREELSKFGVSNAGIGLSVIKAPKVNADPENLENCNKRELPKTWLHVAKTGLNDLSITEAPKEYAASEGLAHCSKREPPDAFEHAKSGFKKAGRDFSINEISKEYAVHEELTNCNKRKHPETYRGAQSGLKNAGSELSVNGTTKECAVREDLTNCNKRKPPETVQGATFAFNNAGIRLSVIRSPKVSAVPENVAHSNISKLPETFCDAQSSLNDAGIWLSVIQAPKVNAIAENLPHCDKLKPTLTFSAAESDTSPPALYPGVAEATNVTGSDIVPDFFVPRHQVATTACAHTESKSFDFRSVGNNYLDNEASNFDFRSIANNYFDNDISRNSVNVTRDDIITPANSFIRSKIQVLSTSEEARIGTNFRSVANNKLVDESRNSGKRCSTEEEQRECVVFEVPANSESDIPGRGQAFSGERFLNPNEVAARRKRKSELSRGIKKCPRTQFSESSPGVIQYSSSTCLFRGEMNISAGPDSLVEDESADDHGCRRVCVGSPTPSIIAGAEALLSFSEYLMNEERAANLADESLSAFGEDEQVGQCHDAQEFYSSSANSSYPNPENMEDTFSNASNAAEAPLIVEDSRSKKVVNINAKFADELEATDEQAQDCSQRDLVSLVDVDLDRLDSEDTEDVVKAVWSYIFSLVRPKGFPDHPAMKIKCFSCSALFSCYLDAERHSVARHRATWEKIRNLYLYVLAPYLPGGVSWNRSQLKFKCIFCSRHLSCDSDLERHLAEMHHGDTPYDCPFCPERFSCVIRYSSHLNEHGFYDNFPSYACKACTECFCSQRELHLHFHAHESPS